MVLKKSTVSQVAQLAGVSITTVSMVLNSKGRISKSTAKKVHHAMEQLDYVPNRAAAALRTRKSNVIGLILRDMTQPFYMSVAAGLSDEIEKAGYMLFISQTGGQYEAFENCVNAMQHQQVSAIVFSPHNSMTESRDERSAVALLRSRGVTALCVSRASQPLDIDQACPDNSRGVSLVLEALVSNGHRLVAYVGGRGNSLTRAEYLAGYCTVLMKGNLPFHPEWIIETDGSRLAGELAVRKLLNIQPKITAIICQDTPTAIGVACGLKQAGRSIGPDSHIDQQITLAVLDCAPGIELLGTDFVGLKQSAKEIGQQTGERILQRIKNEGLPAQRIMLMPQVVNGNKA